LKNEFLNELQWRGLVHQCTDIEQLAERLNLGPMTLYCGFDPTALSLHVGNLIPLISLARFQRAGHRVLALVGGATGLIGDPSGKSAERVLQSESEVQRRAEAIQGQLSRVIDVADAATGAVVNNLAWTQPMGVLEFLRDVGKHFSVNAMMHRDSIRSRLDREGEGISFTEFSYMLLQAFDFLKLAELENCRLQIGGSDQWGNMCSGTDLIRRARGEEAFALTLPLLTNSNGAKFGKSEKGAIWLDAALTSPWEFYQFWLNTPDEDVIRLLKLFTFVSREEIEMLEITLATEAFQRVSQKRLAAEMTEMIHGEQALAEVLNAVEALFGNGSVDRLGSSLLEMLMLAVPSIKLTSGETRGLNSLLVETTLVPSMSKANEIILQGGVSVNNVKKTEAQAVPLDSDWLHGRFLLIKKGKKNFALVERAS